MLASSAVLVGKRVAAVCMVLLTFAALMTLKSASHQIQRVFPYVTTTQPPDLPTQNNDPVHARLNVTDEGLEPEHWLRGPPTINFRDNLLPDVQYITSFASAGWTNDVIALSHLIYLAILTDRVPILPPFAPVHISPSNPTIPFGDVFDLPRFRALVDIPVLEWQDVKQVDEMPAEDVMGCISVWMSQQYDDPKPRGSRALEQLNLDISYTQAPTWIKLMPGNEHDKYSTFWSLAALAFPHTRKANMKSSPIPSPRAHVSLPPDDHLLCYDYLYYVCALGESEWDKDYGPAWRFVGKHLHWIQPLEDLADSYVRAAMGINSDKEKTPPYIAVHVRHHDFAQWCRVPKEECFATIPVIARRVREVQDELFARKKITILSNRVIVLSDETDEAWWDEVRSQGWLRIDHSHTGTLYGEWYSIFIDAVIQSGGQGFVGTDLSTMSILARRRVEDWHNGVTRMVKWGSKHADAH